jgi:hypothetical protein
MARRHLTALLTAALLALVFAAVALAVTPQKGIYLGQTSQGRDVGIKVNDQQRIKQFRIEYRAPCGGGAKYTGGVIDRDKPAKHPNDKIKQQNGVFEDKGQFKQNAGGGLKAKVNYEVHGEFDTPTTASGRFKVKVKVTENGETIDTCEKKGITWDVSG